MTTDLTKRIDANGIKALLNSSQSLEPKAVGIQFLVMITLSVSLCCLYLIFSYTELIVLLPVSNDHHIQYFTI